VYAKYFLINDRGNWKTIEAIRERFPELDVVPALTFIIKAINSVDRGTFVVPSQKKKVLWVFDFVSQQEADSFQTLFASVNVITKKKIICIRGKPPYSNKRNKS